MTYSQTTLEYVWKQASVQTNVPEGPLNDQPPQIQSVSITPYFYASVKLEGLRFPVNIDLTKCPRVVYEELCLQRYRLHNSPLSRQDLRHSAP